MDHIAEQIDSFLIDNLDVYIAETKRLCAQRSVSAEGGGGLDDLIACANLVAETLKQHGLQAQVLSTAGAPVVVGHADGESERTLLFYNHYDVQPASDDAEWLSPPFEPEVRDGALYARGAHDDKGELLARLAAVDAVKAAHGGTLPCGVTFVVEGEEESGSMNIRQFVLDHLDLLRCHGAIWEEGEIDHKGRPLMTLGKRGLLYVEFRVKTMEYDGHSGKANVLPNAAWRLHTVLAILKDENGRIRIPGFYDHLLPPSERDLELLEALESDDEEERHNYGVKLAGGPTGSAYKRAVFESTCNIAGLKSGYIEQGSMTIVPAEAMAKIDFRLLPNQDPNDIFNNLRSFLDANGFADVEMESMGPMWPAKVSPDDPLVELARRAGADVYGKPGQITPISWGSSPMHEFVGPLGGIPVVEAGVGYPGSRNHASNEHVRLQDFVNGAQHIARILDGFASL